MTIDLQNARRDLSNAVKSSLKNIPAETVLASPDIQFGWCRWHLADAGFTLRFCDELQENGKFMRRLVVWRARQPRATRVYFDSLEDLIRLIAERRPICAITGRGNRPHNLCGSFHAKKQYGRAWRGVSLASAPKKGLPVTKNA